MKLSRIYNELVRVEWADHKDLKGSQRNADDVLNYFGDDKDIRTIDYQDTLNYIAHLKGRGLSGSSINRKLAALSKMFTIARRHDRRINRPELPRQKEGQPRQRVLTDDEVKAMTEYAWRKPEWKDFTILLMDTGVRPSEITEGEWHVDGDELTLINTKNGEDRTILLTPDAQAAAMRLKGMKKRLVYSTYYEEFRRVLKALGIKGEVCPYTIRHSALTRLANATDNVLLIQKWAGHKDLATTQRYVKARRTGMEKLADVLRRN